MNLQYNLDCSKSHAGTLAHRLRAYQRLFSTTITSTLCLLTTVTKEDWQSDKLVLTLEQQWFLADGSSGDTPEEKSKLWTIPLLHCTSATAKQPVLEFMKERSYSVTVPLSKAG
jgi:hypothetical protein